MPNKYQDWYNKLDRQARHDLMVKYDLRQINSNNLIRELYVKEHMDDANKATMHIIATHLRQQHGTDGEVSIPFPCAMETPDGTVQMLAYKLSDSHKPDFWVAVERIIED